MSAHARRLTLVATTALCLLLGARRAAFAGEDSPWQIMPELDAHVGLGQRTSLLFLLRRTYDSELGRAEGVLGAHLDYAVHRDLKLRAGYRVIRSFDDDPSPSVEHRALFEVTPREQLPEGLRASLRNRLEYRWQESGQSARYRPRLQIDRPFAIAHARTLTPYASAEVFFDSRFETWSRWRYQGGVETKFSEAFMLAFFYRRQNDLRPAAAQLDLLGITFDVTFE